MEKIYLEIMNRLWSEVPEIKMIDIDWGQLEPSEEHYPVQFPCALIDVPEIEWEESGAVNQPGEAFIKIKLAIQPHNDSHMGSGSTDEAIAKLSVVKTVHTAINRYKIDGYKLGRRKTTCYNIPGGIKVVELTYSVGVFD